MSLGQQQISPQALACIQSMSGYRSAAEQTLRSSGLPMSLLINCQPGPVSGFGQAGPFAAAGVPPEWMAAHTRRVPRPGQTEPVVPPKTAQIAPVQDVLWGVAAAVGLFFLAAYISPPKEEKKD